MAMMTEDQFWNIIDVSREQAKQHTLEMGEDFMDIHIVTLAEVLSTLDTAEIVGFNERFWERHANAYRWDLWAAAYWLGGGCSDDGFIDFRSCIISLGQRNYEAALVNPDALSDVVGSKDAPFMQAEGFQYVARDVYEKKTGHSDWPGTMSFTAQSEEPAGESFDFDDEDEMEQRFPRLVSRFPEGLD